MIIKEMIRPIVQAVENMMKCNYCLVTLVLKTASFNNVHLYSEMYFKQEDKHVLCST